MGRLPARGAGAGSRGSRRRAGRGPRGLVHRWGPLAVVLCFLTVGVQTAVNATAGITRMPLRRYLPAVTLGSILWAALYASVGLAAAQAWLSAAARSPVAATVVAVLLVVGLLVLGVRRRAQRDVRS
uniref:VTT domain-containing protein n=1 Tax=Janibacter limosus TaxID=53458 RepID=A0AC61U1U1_9MICO|nr:VTT domain-containing protein [Janibacter limosus]